MVSGIQLPFNFDQERLSDFCRDRGIQRLSLFGSALRPDFNPETSDVDLFAEFSPEVLNKIGFSFFSYEDDLEQIMGRKVDLCTRLSPLIEKEVKDSAILLYEQA